MGEKQFTVPDNVSEEVRAWAQKENFQLIGVICKGKKEYPIIICPACNCPRLADYKCDTCAKREMEFVHKEFEKKISEFKIFLNQI